MKEKGKALKIILKVVKALITVFLVFVVGAILVQKFSKNTISIGGFRIFTIVSESMAPGYKAGDILIAKSIPAEDIKIGDKVTYLGREGSFTGLVVTHEVIEKREEKGTYYFITKGTANEVADPEINERDIYGKIIYKTIIFGFLGRLMTNIVIYYLLFVLIGVAVCYQVISIFFLHHNDYEDEELDGEEEALKDIEEKVIEVADEGVKEEIIIEETESETEKVTENEEKTEIILEDNDLELPEIVEEKTLDENEITDAKQTIENDEETIEEVEIENEKN